MALIDLTIPTDLRWDLADQLVVLLGDENAASLAASEDGGREVDRQPAWPGRISGGLGTGGLGDALFAVDPAFAQLNEKWLGGRLLGMSAAPEVTLQARHIATDLCAALPVGVKLIDTAGNVSDVTEQIAPIADRPRGVGRVGVGAPVGASSGEAVIAWNSSNV